MLFLSIDIETTGLDKDRDQILHVAAVLEDTEARPLPPVEELPFFECVLHHSRITGNVHALAMNADLIRAMSATDNREAVLHNGRDIPWANPNQWRFNFITWLDEQFPREALVQRPKITVAGKNAAGFDLPFIAANGGKDYLFHHRVIDPGSVAMGAYPDWWGELDTLPGLNELRVRLNMPEAEHKHDALHDAWSVIDILRRLR